MIYLYGGRGFVGSSIVLFLRSNAIDYEIVDRTSPLAVAIRHKSIAIQEEPFKVKENSVLVYLLSGNKYKNIQDMKDFCYFIQTYNIEFKRIIFLSSITVYEGIVCSDLCEDLTDVNLTKSLPDPFGKLASENILLGLNSKSEILIFRVGRIIGKSSYWSEILIKFIKSQKEDLVCTDQCGNFISIQELSFILHKAINGDIPQGVYNLASQKQLTYTDAVTLLSGKVCSPNKSKTMRAIRFFNYMASPFLYALNKIKLSNFLIFSPGLFHSIKDPRLINCNKILNVIDNSNWTIINDLLELSVNFNDY